MRGCWISVSLFSEKENWPTLLQQGIRPLLAQLAISTFRIRFNYLNGTNIQLAVYADEDQCETIAKKLDRHFLFFFSKATLKNQPPNFPGQSLFISFPQNSIQYGLYELDATIEKDRNGPHQLLSEIIMDSLYNDIDDTSLITLALYLHLAVVKVVSKSPNFDPANLDKYFLESYQVIPGGSNGFESFFTENRDSLVEILEDVFIKNFTKDDELFWLTRWVQFCDSEFNNNKKSSEELCQLWSATINNFLGFNTEEKQFFNGLICKTIELKSTCFATGVLI